MNNMEMKKGTSEIATIVDENTIVSVKCELNNEKVVLEKALKLTGVGRYSYILFAICTYSLLAAAVEIFGVGIIITAAQCDLELDVYKKGLIGSLPMLGVMSSGHMWGYVADTRGRKFTLCITMGFTFVSAIISSFSNHWIFLAVFKFFSAMFASGTNAAMYALLGESTPQSHRAKFMLYTATGMMFSQGFIAIIAYPILTLTFEYPTVLGFSYRPWRLLAQTYGLMSGINLILLLFFVYESPKFYLSRGRNKEGIDVLTKMFVVNTGKNAESYPVKHVIVEEEVQSNDKQNFLKSMWNQTVPLLKKPHLKNTFLVCYTSVLMYSVGPPFLIWFPGIFNSYVRNIDKVDENTFCQIIQMPSQVSTSNSSDILESCDDSVDDRTIALMTGYGTYLFFTTASMVPLVHFFGKKWTYIGMHLVCATAALLMDHVKTLASVIIFIILISNGVCIGITTSFAVELFPTYLRAMAVCLTMMVGRTVSFAFINMIGTMLQSNCTNFFYGLGVFVLSGVVVAWFLPADVKNPQKQDVEKTEK